MPSLEKSAPLIAGAVLATSGCASQQLSEPIELSQYNAVYIPANTAVFADPVLDRSEIDSTFLGETKQEVGILSYELTDDKEVACVTKDTINRNVLAEPQNPLYWKTIGRICFDSSELLSALEGWQIYPEKTYYPLTNQIQ